MAETMRERVRHLAEAAQGLRTFSTRANAYPHGDALHLWVNEGDLIMLRMLAADALAALEGEDAS